MAKERFDFIDIAKCLGIILVICSHSICSDIMWIFNGCFIPLFFVASGYVAGKIDMRQKAKRLLKPYLFFSVCMVVLMLVSGLRQMIGTNLLGVVYSRYTLYRTGITDNTVLMNIGNAPMWFLTSMFVAFVWFKILLTLKGNYRYLAIIIYLIMTYVLGKNDLLLPWSIDTSMLLAVFMYVGYVTRNEARKLFSTHRKKIVVLMIVVYIVCFGINGYSNISVGNLGRSVLLATLCGISGSIVLMYLSRLLEESPLCGLLVELGKHSLVIFCVQMPFLYVAKKMIYVALGNELGIVEKVIGALFQMMLAMCGGYALSRVLNRWLPYVFK